MPTLRGARNPPREPGGCFLLLFAAPGACSPGRDHGGVPGRQHYSQNLPSSERLSKAAPPVIFHLERVLPGDSVSRFLRLSDEYRAQGTPPPTAVHPPPGPPVPETPTRHLGGRADAGDDASRRQIPPTEPVRTGLGLDPRPRSHLGPDLASDEIHKLRIRPEHRVEL